ncbi:MAG TPA: DNA polymerase III subunit epsilon [Wenzhouxiangella sp.]|nr:DNA polymerase III subunit epsilon [Wenzhouxiangella sp.]
MTEQVLRQIVLDTETTGLEHDEGHRIIEIGAVEMIERRVTGNNFHVYINPDREVEAGALEIHGITNEFLAEKPRFAELASEFLDFIKGAELVIHNAAFDLGFLDAELARLDRPARVSDYATHLDTLVLARELHPGQRVSLDALCRRYEVDNSGRELHGALLDAQLLAEVYLAMTGGQVDLILEMAASGDEAGSAASLQGLDLSRLVVRRPGPVELEAHNERLEEIRAGSGRCLWDELEGR